MAARLQVTTQVDVAQQGTKLPGDLHLYDGTGPPGDQQETPSAAEQVREVIDHDTNAL